MLAYPERKDGIPYVREIGQVGNVHLFVGQMSLAAGDLSAEAIAFGQSVSALL
jgi:hypothetical protein